MKAFDKAILVALASNGNELSMIELHNHLPGNPYFGSIYVSVERLEKGGYVQIADIPGGYEIGFRLKRMVRLTGHGLAESRFTKGPARVMGDDFTRTSMLRWNGDVLERLWSGYTKVKIGSGLSQWKEQDDWRPDTEFQQLFESGWLPIETAPQDETEILVWGTGPGNRDLASGWFARFMDGRWYHGTQIIFASHWMALVPPKPTSTN